MVGTDGCFPLPTSKTCRTLVSSISNTPTSECSVHLRPSENSVFIARGDIEEDRKVFRHREGKESQIDLALEYINRRKVDEHADIDQEVVSR